MAAGKRQAQPRAKHVPRRTCIACRRGDTKRELVRVVRDAAGRVSVDPTGKRNGRGAYLCPDPACWEAALKRRSIERALRIAELYPDDRRDLAKFMRDLSAPVAAHAATGIAPGDERSPAPTERE